MMGIWQSRFTFQAKPLCLYLIGIITDRQISDNQIDWIEQKRIKAILMKEFNVHLLQISIQCGKLNECRVNLTCKYILILFKVVQNSSQHVTCTCYRIKNTYGFLVFHEFFS